MVILVTGAWKYTAQQRMDLEKCGCMIVDMPNEQGSLPCDPAQVECVICNGLFLYHPIEQFTSLRYIQLTSAGYDRVPMDYIRRNGIEVQNAGNVYSIPMAEFAVSMVLQLYKCAEFFRESQKRHRWEKHRGLRELCGKTVCIVGCGNVGSECAKRFRAFGCQVLGLNRTLREIEGFDAVFSMQEMKSCVSRADVVILSLPLTTETYHIFDKNILADMKDGSLLINLSRGAIVDTIALTEALQQRELFAAMDVFEEEPLAENSLLWDLPNVFITPHNSFVGEGNSDRLFEVIYKNLKIWSIRNEKCIDSCK